MPTTLDLLRALADATQELGGLLEALEDEDGSSACSNRGIWNRVGDAARRVYLVAGHLARAEELDRLKTLGRIPRHASGMRRPPQALPRMEHRIMPGGMVRRSRSEGRLLPASAASDEALFRAFRTVGEHRGLDTVEAASEAIASYVTLSGPWPAFVFRENGAFTIQFANQAALDLLGYKLEELCGQSMCGMYDLSKKRPNISGEFMQVGGVRDVPVGIRKKSGETRAMRLFAKREVKSVGTPRIYAAWKDI